MGCVPDISAQGLRNQKSRLLGLVVAAATQVVDARIVLGLEELAHELGYDLVLAQTLESSPIARRPCCGTTIARRRRIFLSPGVGCECWRRI